MAIERLAMRQIREILRQKWTLGLRHRAVARSLGVGLGTISSVTSRAHAAGLDWAAVQTLTDEALEGRLYGRPDVTWGEAHRLRKGKSDLPISGGPGTSGCFRVIGFRKDADGKLVANTGDSFVFAVEFSQPPKAYTVLSYSQCDVEDSPHFNDQAELVSAGKMKRAAYTDAEIEAQLIRRYKPGGKE